MKKEIPSISIDSIFPPNHNYKYFENSEKHPFRYDSSKCELVNAWWLADAALLAYAEPDFAMPVFKNAGFSVSDSQYIKGESTQCYVVYTDGFVIVSFRGTQVYKPGISQDFLEIIKEVVKDIYTDIKFYLVDSGHEGYVHDGFETGLSEVWDDRIKPYLDELNNGKRKFWFTGHSLGAALATLAASKYRNVQGVYTFGSPLVGTQEFVNNCSIPTFRFVNNKDIVTKIPLIGPYKLPKIGFGRYQHIGELKFISKDGKISNKKGILEQFNDYFFDITSKLTNGNGNLRKGWEDVLRNLGSGFIDHSPLHYAIHIWNQYEQP